MSRSPGESSDEMMRAVRVTPANIHQSMTAQQLFDDLEQRDLCGATLLSADSAYDDKKTYHRCVEIGLIPLIAYNPKKAKIKTFTNLRPSNWRKRCLGPEGFKLYQRHYSERGSVERYNSTFKEILVGRTVPVRGLLKVTRHILLAGILSQLYGIINHTLQTKKQLTIRPTLNDYLRQPLMVPCTSGIGMTCCGVATGV